MIADLVAYDTEGQIALLVEVKSRTNTSPSWAMDIRQAQLARYHAAKKSPFLLIAAPDHLYLWKDAGSVATAAPTYDVDATPFFQPYYEKAGVSPKQLTHQSLELIVTSWLNEIVHFGVSPDTPEPQRRFLEASGLLEAIQDGNVAVEVPL